MLRLLSALNWVQAALLVVVGVWFALMTLTAGAGPFGVVVLVFCLALAVPFAYLGAVIDKGRGRGLQTALAALALLAFPVGTLFGALSLYAVWFSEARLRFEGGPVTEAPEDEVIDDAWPEGESPYAYARRMADAGLRAGALRARLEERGLAPDEVETLLGAVGLAPQVPERGHTAAPRLPSATSPGLKRR